MIVWLWNSKFKMIFVVPLSCKFQCSFWVVWCHSYCWSFCMYHVNWSPIWKLLWSTFYPEWSKISWCGHLSLIILDCFSFLRFINQFWECYLKIFSLSLSLSLFISSVSFFSCSIFYIDTLIFIHIFFSLSISLGDFIDFIFHSFFWPSYFLF